VWSSSVSHRGTACPVPDCREMTFPQFSTSCFYQAVLPIERGRGRREPNFCLSVRFRAEYSPAIFSVEPSPPLFPPCRRFLDIPTDLPRRASMCGSSFLPRSLGQLMAHASPSPLPTRAQATSLSPADPLEAPRIHRFRSAFRPVARLLPFFVFGTHTDTLRYIATSGLALGFRSFFWAGKQVLFAFPVFCINDFNLRYFAATAYSNRTAEPLVPRVPHAPVF